MNCPACTSNLEVNIEPTIVLTLIIMGSCVCHVVKIDSKVSQDECVRFIWIFCSLEVTINLTVSFEKQSMLITCFVIGN